MTEVNNLQYAPGPPAVGYDPLKGVEWLLGSAQHKLGVREPLPWYPKAASDPKEGLPIFGVKQCENSPLDFGPYRTKDATLTTVSWPGLRPAPLPFQVVTLFVNDVNGEKVPIKCKLSDPVADVRAQIFQKMAAQMKLVEHDDDADTRLATAITNPTAPDTRMNTVKDVAHTNEAIPGSVHYSQYMHVDPNSLSTDRQIRKPVPIAGKYQPPKRCPQKPDDLELYVGAVKMDDGQLDFSKSLNTGAKPTWQTLRLYDFMISDGTVLRAEYTLSTAEYKIKDPDRDMNKLGNLNDLNTACARVSDTVLDPDFYVSTTEQMPRLLWELLSPAGGDEDGPFVGTCVPIPETSSGTQGRMAYRTQYANPISFIDTKPTSVAYEPANPTASYRTSYIPKTSMPKEIKRTVVSTSLVPTSRIDNYEVTQASRMSLSPRWSQQQSVQQLSSYTSYPSQSQNAGMATGMAKGALAQSTLV